MKQQKQVAILYQAGPAPVIGGIRKPYKEGGYSDSGADIAVALQTQGVVVVVPVKQPNVLVDLDWVFPDDREGIAQALSKGVDTFWLNTVLFADHPILQFIEQGISIVGQRPGQVHVYDDKTYTNQLLANHGLTVVEQMVIHENHIPDLKRTQFPMVLKPVRGRGSQGVSVVTDNGTLQSSVKRLLSQKIYGDSFYIERYLPGREITITVMPPGRYRIGGTGVTKTAHWALPVVERFNHQNGIAPYSGTVAVIHNSKVVMDQKQSDIKQAVLTCEQSGAYLGIKAPIRIDLRADHTGRFWLFDVNLKPNMTGPSRNHRMDQASLTAMAAKAIGWSYEDLIINILNQSWSLDS